ncbi:neocarzinostatin apoprotein domain-containing protein [Streptomyces sp. NPDC003247]|uniref:neocarzinostatin apoprotein domain-containing protein n=1 Tax=Streptomyces sp. NPDC003247 TaxID=3364677 RepID=UPI0036B203DB
MTTLARTTTTPPPRPRLRLRRAALALAVCGPLLLPLSAPAAAADGGATVTVSRTTGLTEGQRITVTGQGFTPGLTSVAVGLCAEHYRSNADCDLTGGAALVNIDARGRLPEVTLTVHGTVAGTDCRTKQCVVGVSPLPTGTPASLRPPNTVDIRIGLAGGTVTGDPSGTGRATTASAAPSAAGSGGEGLSTPLWSLALAAVVLCAAGAVVVSRPPRHPDPAPLSHTGGTP